MSDLSPQGYIDQRTNHPFWGGGGGGTYNYNELENKPLINNVTLQGNLTLAQLGIPVYSVFSTGTAGLVPAPTAEDSGKFLRADGTWQTVGGGGGGGLTLDLESSWYSTIDVFSRIDRMVLDLSRGYGTTPGSMVSSIFGALLQGENASGAQSLYLSFGPRIDLMGTIYHDDYDTDTHSTEPIAQYGITPREMRMIFNVDLYDTTEEGDHWVTGAARNVYFEMENPIDLDTYGETSSVHYKLPLMRGGLFDEDNYQWISAEYAGITNLKFAVDGTISQHPDGFYGRDIKYIQVGYDHEDGATGSQERLYLPGGGEPKTYYRGIINTATPMSISSLQTAVLSVDLASNTNNAGEIGLQLGTTELVLSSYSPSVAYSTPRDLLLRKVQDVVYEDGISGFTAYIIDGVCETEFGLSEYEYAVPSSAVDGPEVVLTPTSQQAFPIYYNEAVTSGGATAVMSRSVNLTNLKVSLVGATLYEITQYISGMTTTTYKILIPKNQSTTYTISSNPGVGKITTRLNSYIELTVPTLTIDGTNPV